MQESADQTKRLRYFNSTSIQVVPAEIEDFPFDGLPPIQFLGARKAATIVEDGYEITSGEAPPLHHALNDSRLLLMNKTTSVRPWEVNEELTLEGRLLLRRSREACSLFYPLLRLSTLTDKDFKMLNDPRVREKPAGIVGNIRMLIDIGLNNTEVERQREQAQILTPSLSKVEEKGPGLHFAPASYWIKVR